MKQTVTVHLEQRSYDIVIAPNLLEDSKTLLEPIVKQRRIAVVTDQYVGHRYLPSFAPVLDSITTQWNHFVISDGESAKSFNGLETLLNAMLESGFDRECLVIAFGGGVVGDVSGFAAKLLMRGIELIQIPTTLMSQVDSSVGGKNGINTHLGKNLLGTFLQPRIVLNDVSLLNTLPVEELRAGYGEIIKYGLLRGEQHFKWLENNLSKIVSCDALTLVKVIAMGCETKAQIVSEDELDRGKRAFVNLGHTFAHAFETQAGFGEMPHGHAVAIGLIAACDLSQRIGLLEEGISNRVRQHVAHADLPTTLNQLCAKVTWDAHAIHASMKHDKKTVNGKINFVLLTAMGHPVVTNDVEEGKLLETLYDLGAH